MHVWLKSIAPKLLWNLTDFAHATHSATDFRFIYLLVFVVAVVVLDTFPEACWLLVLVFILQFEFEFVFDWFQYPGNFICSSIYLLWLHVERNIRRILSTNRFTSTLVPHRIAFEISETIVHHRNQSHLRQSIRTQKNSQTLFNNSFMLFFILEFLPLSSECVFLQLNNFFLCSFCL